MSHIATVDLEIRDLDALAEAAQRRGLELVRGQTTQRSYQRGIKCEHALRIPGNSQAYEIGVVSRTDGRPGYVLQWDDYGQHGRALRGLVGRDCGKLKQAYGLAVARRQLTRQGFIVQEQPQPDGSISLVAVGGRSGTA